MGKEKAFKVLTTEKEGEKEVPLTEARVREQMQAGSLRFALIFPPDTESDETFGLKLKFLNNPRNEIETQTVTGLVQKTIYTSAPQALVGSLQKKGAQFIGQENFDQFNHAIANSVAQAFGGDANEIYQDLSKGEIDFGGADGSRTSADGTSLFESLIKIESEQVGGQTEKKSSMATRSVGGWAIMFLLFSLSGAATSLFDEKKAGLFQRLLAAPVRRTHILWSKYLFGMIVGLVQLSALFLAGRLLFGIDITTNLGNLLLICLAASLACVSFGMLLAAVVSDLGRGERSGHLSHPHHERDRRGLVSDQFHAGVHPEAEPPDDRLLVARRLHQGALGELHHAASCCPPRHPARHRRGGQRLQHLAISITARFSSNVGGVR